MYQMGARLKKLKYSKIGCLTVTHYQSVNNSGFFIPYSNRFEEGEFRKRIQFMYGGKLQNITFMYYGSDVDSVLDRLPTAKILEKK